MIVNLLEARIKTINNLEAAIVRINKTYGSKDNKHKILIELQEEFILVQYLGKIVAIPYFKESRGKIVNSAEIKEDPSIAPIYSTIMCSPLWEEEIFNLIVNSFNKEYLDVID